MAVARGGGGANAANGVAALDHPPPAQQQQQRQECAGFMALARDYLGELVSGSKQGRDSVLARMRALAYEKGPRAQTAARQTMADLHRWMQESGHLKIALLGAVSTLFNLFFDDDLFLQVGLVGLAALVALATFVVVFVSATANAMMISLILSISLVGFLMASFFTSLTAVYVGALLAAGVTISSLTFFSICGMIMAAGWFTFSWGIWNFVRKIFQIVRYSAGSVWSALSSQPVAEISVESLKQQ
ncbi:uncharacterized protein LOC112347300 isoform X1 [Selaginella moellendorffii]|uniref:uncharacterized protein LOC112347300 isoform X1 n=1 Tax=Selaginella moellendorffii TaxID=88036 RepID=UPI000D1C9A06|nr:uncharacterized protein LOC112347300 isoform X1 [Selaginella moellendorffii]|eukprot:XP_024533764.1 uncharacterized protein LOC112347300 isoform X1 [Selaginella moellendorffii]